MTKTKKTKTKELKLNPTIAEHDLNVKIENAKKWIDKGHRVKVSISFRGRIATRKEAGMASYNKVIKALVEYGGIMGSPTKDVDNTVTTILDSKSK